MGDTAVSVCTSDEARSKVLALAYKVNNVDVSKLTQEEIYKIESDNGISVRMELFAECEAKIQALADTGKKTCVFVLDKNHVSPMLVDKVNEVANNCFANGHIKRSILVPEDVESFNKSRIYPFKRETLMICLERSLYRKEHLTMKYGVVHSLLSFVSCLRSQIKEDFDAKFPTQKYTRIVAPYYDRDVVQQVGSDKKYQDALVSLEELILELVDNKKTVSEACPEVMHLVEILAPLNKFANLDDKAVSSLGNAILAAK